VIVSLHVLDKSHAPILVVLPQPLSFFAVADSRPISVFADSTASALWSGRPLHPNRTGPAIMTIPGKILFFMADLLRGPLEPLNGL
jgi:hypothetical protein